MDMKSYLDELGNSEDQETFANRADTSVAYLKQLASGFRRAGLKTILAIEDASDGKVTRYDLRPDLFYKDGKAA